MSPFQYLLLILSFGHVLSQTGSMREYMDLHSQGPVSLNYDPDVPARAGIGEVAPGVKYYANPISTSVAGVNLMTGNRTPAVMTWYLPWDDGKSVAMMLTPANHWFFTGRLEGCELWIAQNDGNDVVIMHINGVVNERCDKDRALTLARATLTYLQQRDQSFRLIHRITRQDADLDRHLTTFCRDYMGVQVSAYATNSFFYGEYQGPAVGRNPVQYNQWTFKMKSERPQRYRSAYYMFLRTVTAPLFYPLTADLCHSTSIGSTFWGYIGRLSNMITGRQKRGVVENTLCTFINSTLSRFQSQGNMHVSYTPLPTQNDNSLGTFFGGVQEDRRVRVFELFPFSLTNAPPFNIIEFENVSYDCNTTELKINTKVLGDLAVIPQIFELQNITFSISATLSPVVLQQFVLQANWGIGGINGYFTIAEDLQSLQFLMRGGPTNDISIDFGAFIENLAGQRISLPTTGSVVFRDVEVVGEIDTFSGGTATFAISGKYGQRNSVHIILQRQSSSGSSRYAAAFSAEISQFSFANLVRDLTGSDITGIPFLGSLVVPTMGLTLATADIHSSILLQVIDDKSLLRFSTGYIQQGFTAYFNLSEMDGTPVKLSYSNSRFSFEVLNGHSVSLSTLLSKVGLNLNSVTLPPGIRDITNLRIMQFSINASSGELLIDLSFPDTLSYFSGLINIQNVVIKVHAVLKAPRTISVEASGHFRIGDQMFDVYIKRDSRNNKYILSSKFFRISISDIIAGFQAAVFPDELNDIIMTSGFYDFSIKNLSMSVVLGAQPLQIQMSGSPVINGYQAPYINAIVIRQGGKTNLVEGFELGSTNLADLVQSVSGLNVRSITVLNQQLEAAILISPVTLPNVRLQGQHLSGFSVNKGISLQATLTWPSDCSSDLFCAAAQTLLGQNARMMLQGTITNTESFNLMAGVSDIRLGSGLTMTQAGFEVRVLGPQIQFGIFGSLHIGDPDITLNAAIRVGTRGIVLDLSMTGCWEQAFGADWLTICSLQGLIALKPELDFLPGGLAFGGQVKIGKPSCSQLQGGGFVGIDVDSPQEDYYYVNINGELTFRSVLGAFCINIDLPRPLAESGFPEGFLSSFSLLGKELPHVPLSIPQGYRLKGKFNILGLIATVDINIGLPGGLKAVVILPPLNLANGLLTMYASRSDSSKGPYLNASIGLIPPNVNIEASGYLLVLGISVDAQLRINNSAYQLTIEGKMLRLFQASLEITASYGNIRSASFRVRGRFRNDLCDRVKGIIENALRRSSEEATRAISDAQRVVNEKKAVLDGANRELSQAQAEVNRCQRKFDDAVRKLQNAQADVNGLCTPLSCSDVCVPAPCGTTCVARVWGRCVLVRPTFSSCCFRAPNLPCEAARAACIAIRETANLALQAAKVLVDQSRHVLDVAIAALEVAKGVVNVAKLPFDAAVAALEAVKQTYRVGAEAANQIARFGLGGVVNLKEITFDVSLSVAAGGSFGGSVRGCLAGNNVQLNININLHDVVAIARQIADHVISGLSSIF